MSAEKTALVENDFDWYTCQPITLPKPQEDTSYDWYSPANIYNMANPSLCLVGLGPHARRIYIHYMKEMNKAPRLIIDLASNKAKVLAFLKKNNLNSNTLFIPDAEKDLQTLSDTTKQTLKRKLDMMGITHAVISTEPKAHKAYLEYFIEMGIHTLSDKPVTAPSYVNDSDAHQKIWQEYEALADLYKNQQDTLVTIQCQRRFHPVYRFIKDTLADVVKAFQIPVTYIDSYHCDGMWNMPDEFLYRENHPYKYGYGKLFHSGYHFIDLVCWLLQVNNHAKGKKADSFELYTNDMRPNDFMHIINDENYAHLFENSKLDSLFADHQEKPIDATGEIDLHALIRFTQKDKLVTTVNLGLMQNGFSRRAWMNLPEDTYKSNGRVRHERMNIQVGPLMNIQLHSYQAKEVAERDSSTTDNVGELEHLDVYIFRNTDLIGGEPLEVFSAKDIMDKHGDQFIGFNESARKNCLTTFLQTEKGSSDLLDHTLSVQILEKCYASMSARASGSNPIIHAKIKENEHEPS
jgi:predicted dehydrogenase